MPLTFLKAKSKTYEQIHSDKASYSLSEFTCISGAQEET